MRRLLLWCAQNQWLKAHVPQWRFARRAVRRFMPGEDFESALKAAETFQAKGIGAVFTRLGENVTAIHEADAVVNHYMDVLAASSSIGAEISVKPTQLGLDIDPEAAYTNLKRLAEATDKAGSFLWIDMEGSAYTQPTLDLFTRLRPGHHNTGICLQAYLRRTAADIVALLPLQPAIRLVKGAYAEPSDIVFASKRDVDANYLALCAVLLPEVSRKSVRLVLATHDVELIASVWRFGAALGMKEAELEVNMLYGIRTDELISLARQGFVVKNLIAYGEAWYAWYLRRLAERPANVLFVARQLLE
jgi:proline dehydrogenase